MLNLSILTRLRMQKPFRDGNCGFFCYPEGMRYEGEWQDDKPHGIGVMTWPQLSGHYTGQYKGGKRDGWGSITFSDKSVWQGEWREDKLVHGSYTWLQSGRTYSGDWDGLHRHGYGSYRWPDGSEFIGLWMHDKRHGWGVYVWPDGARYEGEWQDSKRSSSKPGLYTAPGEALRLQVWRERFFDASNRTFDLLQQHADQHIVQTLNESRPSAPNVKRQRVTE